MTDLEPATGRTASSSSILNFDASDVTRDPFPHVLSTEFLRPELFERLLADFPGDGHFDGKPEGGRTGRDFYPDDPGFQDFLRSSEAWREFHGFINSGSFVDFVIECFGPHLDAFGGKVDPSAVTFEQHVESRDELANHGRLGARMRRLFGRRSDLTNQLYTRFDIEQGGAAYAKPVHCDHESRFASLVLYFSDSDELEMDGGDLQIHRHRQSKAMERYERHPRPGDTEVVATVRPKPNTGVLFLCCNNSYHGVTEIKSANGYRRFCYLNVSSRAARIW